MFSPLFFRHDHYFHRTQPSHGDNRKYLQELGFLPADVTSSKQGLQGKVRVLIFIIFIFYLFIYIDKSLKHDPY